MKNRINLEFSGNFTVVEIIDNDLNSFGFFATFMEFIEKLSGLHSEGVISDFAVVNCINTYLEQSQIVTGFYGSMTPLFIVDRMFPFLGMEIPPIFHKFLLLNFDNCKACMFGYVIGNTYYALSEYMLFTFEAHEFLEFLAKHNLINKEVYENFLISIKSNILFNTSKQKICN